MIKIDFVSDIVCPWCFVGKRRLEKAIALLPEMEFEINLVPFQLNPSLEDKVELKSYLEAKYGGDGSVNDMQNRVEAVANQEGIQMDFSKATHTYNTMKCHAVIQSRESVEEQLILKEAFMSAHFEQGLDISSETVLQEAADKTGIELDVAATINEANIAKVNAKQNQYRGMGINSVPSFIVNGKYLIQGAQPPDVLVSSFQKMLAQDD